MIHQTFVRNVWRVWCFLPTLLLAFADKPLIGLSSNLVGHWISIVSWPLICRAISVHWQTNCWSDWAQIWWAGPIYDGTPLPPRPILTFGHAAPNFNRFLAYDWSSSFRAFADKPLIKLGSTLVGQAQLIRMIKFRSCSLIVWFPSTLIYPLVGDLHPLMPCFFKWMWLKGCIQWMFNQNGSLNPLKLCICMNFRLSSLFFPNTHAMNPFCRGPQTRQGRYWGQDEGCVRAAWPWWSGVAAE